MENQINEQELIDLQTKMWIETSERALEYAGRLGYCKGTFDIILLNLKEGNLKNIQSLCEEAINLLHKPIK